MIDQQLISSATKHAEQSIATSKIVNADFRLISNLLHPDIDAKLHNFVLSADDSLWSKVPLQETLPRRSINWAFDTIIEELHIIAENLTNCINTTFDTTDIKFQGLQLWKDCSGYTLTPHRDNPVIDVSMQIYLFDCGEKYGTTFEVNDSELAVPFVHNTGYLLHKKSYEERLLHWTTTSLPAGIERYSLYLTWSVYGKQAPDPNDIVHLM